jgi:hydroxymethylglutaryl-CoA lyase
MTPRPICLVEVGPRDGFQAIGPLIETAQKIALIDALYHAGLRRMEATAFVSPKALPQLADAAEVLAHAQTLDGLDVQVLTPNLRHAERALDAGATHLAFVLSVSEAHNRSNVRCSPQASVAEYRQVARALNQKPGAKMRLNVATAFDCPKDGPVPPGATLALLEPLLEAEPAAEVCLCDTTGRVTPDRVRHLFEVAQARFPGVMRWAYHGHDTYGLGVANVLAALGVGVGVIDAAFGGLGGCPFAPGATGNVATEDVVWTLQAMGYETGVALAPLLAAARAAIQLPGAQHGGRVRRALEASAWRQAAAA